MKPTLDWGDLRFVLAAHRRASHGGAARDLGVDPTTVGRRIASLEEAFGTRLFDRTPGGLVATAAGQALVARAERAEAELLAAERELGGVDARLAGPVRVTAGDGIIHYAVIPALPALHRAHPDIVVELRADTRALDLSRREADVALRLARPREPSLVARRVGAMRFGLYASRAYLDRRGAPRRAAELAGHDLVGFDASLDDLPQVRWLRRQVGAPRWTVRATTTTAQVLACAAGAGIALVGTFIAPHEPRLVPVLPALQPPPRDLWLVMHQDLRGTARVAAVSAWLAAATIDLA
ncbi:MAG: LysR family transcriptional regulator [Deltaproteobacteria bacterium]|nr:LysR family transcriptional regulator [Deltaproteobacteria bacterium]